MKMFGNFGKLVSAAILGAVIANVGPALARQIISQDLTVKGTIGVTAPITVGNGTGIVSGGSTVTALCATTTAGFCVYFGTGTPTISAAQGSIYLNNAGSSTSTRIYVNSNGTTGWVAVTTAS